MFRKKIYFTALLVILMVAGFLATSLTSYFVASDSLSRQISEQALPLTSDNIYSEIQRDLLRPVLISSLMASDTFLRNWVINGEQELEQIETYLREIQDRYDTITAFFISDQSRNYYHSSGLLREVSATNPDDDWYFRVRDMNDPYEINIDEDTADPERVSIFVNYRVMDYEGSFIGATGVGLSVESVTRMIDNYQQRYGRTIYFTDRQGNITLTGSGGHVAAGRLQDRAGAGALSTRILSMPSSNLSYRNDAGESVFINSRLVPEFDWYLMVEQEDTPASSVIENTLWVNVALALGILSVVLLAAHFTLRAYQTRLEEMATTDQLTGIANRHAFRLIFDQVSRSSTRLTRPVSLVLIDIDHFKRVNDDYGHPGGDEVLKAISNTISDLIRESDTLCRWGGEEFILLLDDCPAEEALTRVNTIREAVRTLRIPFGTAEIRVSLSCGVAERHKGESLDYVIKRVDKALYQAKEQGRDRVCLAPGEAD